MRSNAGASNGSDAGGRARDSGDDEENDGGDDDTVAQSEDAPENGGASQRGAGGGRRVGQLVGSKSSAKSQKLVLRHTALPEDVLVADLRALGAENKA